MSPHIVQSPNINHKLVFQTRLKLLYYIQYVFSVGKISNEISVHTILSLTQVEIS